MGRIAIGQRFGKWTTLNTIIVTTKSEKAHGFNRGMIASNVYLALVYIF